MSLDSLTNNAMDLLPILQFGFVIIDMDVSDGLWQHFQKMPWIHYIYWNFRL